MSRFARYAAATAKVIVSAIATLAVLAALSHVVMPKNNQEAFGALNAAANGVQGERKDSIDVLFIGDSEVFSSFSPLQLWKDQGITSYASATSGQTLPYSRTLLLRALETQTPKVVVLETNSLYAPFSTSNLITRMAQDALPVLEYHNRWKTLRAEDLTAPVESTWTDDLKGFSLVNRVYAAQKSGYMDPTDATDDLPDLNRRVLEDIIRICEKRGIKVMLTTVPTTINWSKARHNSIASFAAEHGLQYVDFNEPGNDPGIDWSKDTSDGGDHLNLRGAQKTTRAIGPILVEKYGLESHAGDKAYASWDQAYSRYEKRLGELQWAEGAMTPAKPIAT